MKKTPNFLGNLSGSKIWFHVFLINIMIICSSVCVILDFENFSVKHLYRPIFRVISQISDTVEANYPETLGR